MDENSQQLQQIMLELTESIKFLNESVSTNTSVRHASLTEEQKERLKNSESLGRNTGAVTENTTNTRQLNRVQEDAIESAKRYNQRMQEFAKALETGTAGVSKVFDKLISQTDRSFNKYSEGVSQLTDSLGKVVSQFGPLGKVVGLVVSGLGTMYKLQAEQADKLHAANDEIAKLGTAGSFTINQLREMANASGVTSKNMGLLVNPIKSLGTSLTNLGNTSGDGVKAFANLTKITNEQREGFQRLGISQEDLIQNQADYVKLQSMAGGFVKRELQDRNALQKASLEYTENLLVLASVTGQDVNKVKAAQQEQLNQVNFQVKQVQLINKARELEAAGKTEEAKKYFDQAKNMREGMSQLAGLNNKVLSDAAREMMTTGTITGKNAQAIARLGLTDEVAKFAKAVKNGGNAQEEAGKLQDSFNKKFGKTVNEVGFSASLSEEIAEAFGINKDTLQRYVQDLDKTYGTQLGIEKDKIKESKKPGKDPAQDSRAKLTTIEIEAGKAMDKLVGATNILTGGFTAQTVALTAFGAALVTATGLLTGKLAGQLTKAGAGALSRVTGGLGLPGGAPGGFAGGAPGGRMPTGVPGLPGLPSGGTPPIPTAPPVPARIPGMPSAAGADMGGALKSAGKGLGDLGAGAGKFISSVGKGGGKAIQSILEGTAKGLAAFGGPVGAKAVLGAGMFGAAIAALSAGVAGAAWMLGKTLPTLAAGFGAFEKLDGQKLIATGKGVAALAGGLTVFGATSALANLGNIAGSMVEGMGKLFGVKSPVEKLQEFSKLDIDTEKVKANAEAMQAFNKAVSTMVPIQLDILGSLGMLVGIPFTPLQKFGKLDVDTDKVKTNAEALTAFNKALSTMVPIQLDILGTLASLVGIKPFTKFEEFSKMDIDPQKSTKNADALLAFNKGLSEMKPVPLDVLGTLASLVGMNPFTKFEEFSQLDIDPQKTTKNSEALLAFNKATSEMKPVPTNILGSMASLVGMNPFSQFEEFSKLKINSDQVKKNAEAFEAYNVAMAKAKPSSAGTFSNIAASTAGAVAGVALAPVMGAVGALAAISKPLAGLFKDKKETTPTRQTEVAQTEVAPKSEPVVATAASSSRLEELERKRAAFEKQGPATDSAQSIIAHKNILQQMDRAIANEKAKASAPKAAIGGIFDGPKSGYPVELHGKEKVVPIGTGKKIDDLEEEPRNKIDWEEESEDVDKFSKTLTDTELNLKKFTTTVIKLHEFNQKELEVKEELEDANTDLKGAVKGAFINLSNFADRLKVTTASSPTSQTGTAVQTGSGGTLISGTGAPVTTGAPPVSARPAGAETKPITTPPKPGSMGEKVDTKAMQSAVMKELGSMGISDPKAQANILAQVQAESGFKPRSEELEKYSAKTLFKLYGPGSGNKVRFRSLEEAQSIVDKGPEAVGNIIYGGRMGNAADEGYKYRGRGLIQLTGKSNYEKYSKLLGIDLVKDPDLANDPAVAAKIAAVYFKEKEKRGVDLTDIGAVGKAVGYAGGQAETQKRAQYAKSFESQIPQASRGGVFEGPDSGYVVELHGNETVIPNEKIVSVDKKPLSLFNDGMQQGMQPPELLKSLLHSGVAGNENINLATAKTEDSFANENISGDTFKDMMSQGNLNVVDAVQKLSTDFKDAIQNLNQQLTQQMQNPSTTKNPENPMIEVMNILSNIADKLGEGNSISSKILQYSKV